jgi:hypothetical protein
MMSVGILSDAMQDLQQNDGQAAARRISAARFVLRRAAEGIVADRSTSPVMEQIRAADRAINDSELTVERRIQQAIAKLSPAIRTMAVSNSSPAVTAQVLIDLALFINDGAMFDHEKPVLLDARLAAERIGATAAADPLTRAIHRNAQDGGDLEQKQKELEALLVAAMDQLLFPMG